MENTTSPQLEAETPEKGTEQPDGRCPGFSLFCLTEGKETACECSLPGEAGAEPARAASTAPRNRKTLLLRKRRRKVRASAGSFSAGTGQAERTRVWHL